jgi:hypothetical protein
MLIEKILAEFPAANDLAYQRIFAGKTIFFDTATHKPLAEFPSDLVLASLIVAQAQAREIGRELRRTSEEKTFWDRHFS